MSSSSASSANSDGGSGTTKSARRTAHDQDCASFLMSLKFSTPKNSSPESGNTCTGTTSDTKGKAGVTMTPAVRKATRTTSGDTATATGSDDNDNDNDKESISSKKNGNTSANANANASRNSSPETTTSTSSKSKHAANFKAEKDTACAAIDPSTSPTGGKSQIERSSDEAKQMAEKEKANSARTSPNLNPSVSASASTSPPVPKQINAKLSAPVSGLGSGSGSGGPLPISSLSIPVATSSPGPGPDGVIRSTSSPSSQNHNQQQSQQLHQKLPDILIAPAPGPVASSQAHIQAQAQAPLPLPSLPQAHVPGPVPVQVQPRIPPPASPVPLATNADPNHLSHMDCILREQCCQLFVTAGGSVDATAPVDIVSNPPNLNMMGLVGLRCTFCAKAEVSPTGTSTDTSNSNSSPDGTGNGSGTDNMGGKEKNIANANDKNAAKNATSGYGSPSTGIAFPGCIAEIYKSFAKMKKEHWEDCPHVPHSIRQQIIEERTEETKKSCYNRSPSHGIHGMHLNRSIESTIREACKQEHWQNSAKELGLEDVKRHGHGHGNGPHGHHNQGHLNEYGYPYNHHHGHGHGQGPIAKNQGIKLESAIMTSGGIIMGGFFINNFSQRRFEAALANQTYSPVPIRSLKTAIAMSGMGGSSGGSGNGDSNGNGNGSNSMQQQPPPHQGHYGAGNMHPHSSYHSNPNANAMGFNMNLQHNAMGGMHGTQSQQQQQHRQPHHPYHLNHHHNSFYVPQHHPHQHPHSQQHPMNMNGMNANGMNMNAGMNMGMNGHGMGGMNGHPHGHGGHPHPHPHNMNMPPNAGNPPGILSKRQPITSKNLSDYDVYDQEPRTISIINLPDSASEEKFKDFMGNTDLVDLSDREFIPDYIFLAMAQLQPCKVVPTDRIGTYKNRDLGFKGMSCKHCGGEPGFGRYFPETVRSLSQTTTSQTIVKHIAYKCLKCPLKIRDAVKELKILQEAKDKAAKEKRRSRFDERPKYGSRKVFFQRLWARLHGEEVSTDGGNKNKSNDSTQSSGSDGKDINNASDNGNGNSDKEDDGGNDKNNGGNSSDGGGNGKRKGNGGENGKDGKRHRSGSGGSSSTKKAGNKGVSSNTRIETEPSSEKRSRTVSPGTACGDVDGNAKINTKKPKGSKRKLQNVLQSSIHNASDEENRSRSVSFNSVGKRD